MNKFFLALLSFYTIHSLSASGNDKLVDLVHRKFVESCEAHYAALLNPHSFDLKCTAINALREYHGMLPSIMANPELREQLKNSNLAYLKQK